MGLAAGQTALDVDFDKIEAASSEKPICQVYLSAAQSLTDNTLTALSFGGENFDTHGFHSTSVNPTRVTPTVAGVYRITGSLFVQGATDYTQWRTMARKNGATQYAPAGALGNLPSATSVSVNFTTMLEFNGTTDYVEMCVLQDNTANTARTAASSNPYITMFELEYLRGPS